MKHVSGAQPSILKIFSASQITPIFFFCPLEHTSKCTTMLAFCPLTLPNPMAEISGIIASMQGKLKFILVRLLYTHQHQLRSTHHYPHSFCQMHSCLFSLIDTGSVSLPVQFFFFSSFFRKKKNNYVGGETPPTSIKEEGDTLAPKSRKSPPPQGHKEKNLIIVSFFSSFLSFLSLPT